ncbi:MAG: ribonuclease III [Planctomycetota bacterium]
MAKSSYDEVEDILGYQFRDRSLLRIALTHGSAKTKSRPSNERLEFLGDAVLGFVVTDFLYAEDEEIDEGRMTKVKAQVVSRKCLTDVAGQLGLAAELDVGRMFSDPSQLPSKILGNAVEAILGAIWLDGGLDGAIDFVDEFFGAAIDEALEAPGDRDYKSRLGQWAQQRYHVSPTYELDEVEGLDHALTFHVSVVVEGVTLGDARGLSKKAAEQEAARRALEHLESTASKTPPASPRKNSNPDEFGAGLFDNDPTRRPRRPIL